MSRPVRAQVRRALPSEVFTPRPLRALLIPAWGAVALALGGAIIFAGLPWWLDLGLALLLGHTFGALGFSAHEVLHGSTVRSRRLQDVLGFVGFFPFFTSPTLWREWHNTRHHAHANQGRRDPDAFGHVSQYQPGGKRHAYQSLLPGSGTWVSHLFLGYWFTAHNLLNLFLLSKYYRGFDRRPALVEFGVAVAGWVGIATVATLFAGWEVVLISLVPMMIGNLLTMGYISTNHMMRPECDHDEPVDNSMSLDVPWIADVLHGWFSHHVEHHLFPSMNPTQAPKVRAWLREEMPERYISPAWYKAIWWLYRTPRPYADPHTLQDPVDPSRTVDLDKLTEELRDDRWTRLRPSDEAPQDGPSDRKRDEKAA